MKLIDSRVHFRVQYSRYTQIIDHMQNGSNTHSERPDVRTLTKKAILNFKELSSNLKSGGRNAIKLPVLSLYILLCLHDNRPMLRYHLSKRLRVNYYDVGNAIYHLMQYQLISVEEAKESSNFNSVAVSRKRYRLSLNGTIYVSDLLNQVQG